MAHIDHPMLTNFQGWLYLPERHGRGRLWSQIGMSLRLWRDRIRQRAELARLHEYDLHDMGLSPADADRELAKWFWQD